MMKVLLLVAVAGCDAFSGVSAHVRHRARVVVMNDEPYEAAATVPDVDVSEAAAKAKWLADRFSPQDEDPAATKWARDEAAKAASEIEDTVDVDEAAKRMKEMLRAKAASEIDAPASKEEMAKADLMNVANSLGSLGVAFGKATVHSIAAITLDGGKAIVGAAGDALTASVLDLRTQGHEFGEELKATVQAAPAKAAAHLKAEAAAAPGKVTQAVQAAAQARIEAVKADVAAMPGKARRNVERKLKRKAERIKADVRNAAVGRIDRLLNRPTDGV